jgi:hypothetical protein
MGEGNEERGYSEMKSLIKGYEREKERVVNRWSRRTLFVSSF